MSENPKHPKPDFIPDPLEPVVGKQTAQPGSAQRLSEEQITAAIDAINDNAGILASAVRRLNAAIGDRAMYAASLIVRIGELEEEVKRLRELLRDIDQLNEEANYQGEVLYSSSGDIAKRIADALGK